MLLQNRNAVIYGGGGAIGGAVARAFAREGEGLPRWSHPDKARLSGPGNIRREHRHVGATLIISLTCSNLCPGG